MIHTHTDILLQPTSELAKCLNFLALQYQLKLHLNCRKLPKNRQIYLTLFTWPSFQPMRERFLINNNEHMVSLSILATLFCLPPCLFLWPYHLILWTICNIVHTCDVTYSEMCILIFSLQAYSIMWHGEPLNSDIS